MTPEIQDAINKLQGQITDLQGQFYKNNFPTSQVFTKGSSFTTTLKVPSYAVDPTVCTVGQIVEVGGKLKVCSSADTWTIVGTQS